VLIVKFPVIVVAAYVAASLVNKDEYKSGLPCGLDFNPDTHPIKNKGSPYSITERRVPELIPVLGSQPGGDVSHKPDGCYKFCCSVNRGTMAVNSLPKTVNRQRRDCDLNPGPSAPESSTLTIRLPSHPPTPYLQKKKPVGIHTPGNPQTHGRRATNRRNEV